MSNMGAEGGLSMGEIDMVQWTPIYFASEEEAERFMQEVSISSIGGIHKIAAKDHIYTSLAVTIASKNGKNLFFILFNSMNDAEQFVKKTPNCLLTHFLRVTSTDDMYVIFIA